MKFFWLTWVLAAAVAVRAASDMAIFAWLAHYAFEGPFARGWEDAMRLIPRWAVRELPETIRDIVMVVMVEGLHRVWLNLLRLRRRKEMAA